MESVEIKLFQVLKQLSSNANETAARETVELIKEMKSEGAEQLASKKDVENIVGKAKLAMIFWYIGISTVQTATMLTFLYFILKK